MHTGPMARGVQRVAHPIVDDSEPEGLSSDPELSSISKLQPKRLSGHCVRGACGYDTTRRT